jgi:hypothetical protein
MPFYGAARVAGSTLRTILVSTLLMPSEQSTARYFLNLISTLAYFFPLTFSVLLSRNTSKIVAEPDRVVSRFIVTYFHI